MNKFKQSNLDLIHIGATLRAFYRLDNGKQIHIGDYSGSGKETIKMIIQEARTIVTNVNER